MTLGSSSQRRAWFLPQELWTQVLECASIMGDLFTSPTPAYPFVHPLYRGYLVWTLSLGLVCRSWRAIIQGLSLPIFITPTPSFEAFLSRLGSPDLPKIRIHSLFIDQPHHLNPDSLNSLLRVAGEDLVALRIKHGGGAAARVDTGRGITTTGTEDWSDWATRRDHSFARCLVKSCTNLKGLWLSGLPFSRQDESHRFPFMELVFAAEFIPRLPKLQHLAVGKSLFESIDIPSLPSPTASFAAVTTLLVLPSLKQIASGPTFVNFLSLFSNLDTLQIRAVTPNSQLLTFESDYWKTLINDAHPCVTILRNIRTLIIEPAEWDMDHIPDFFMDLLQSCFLNMAGNEVALQYLSIGFFLDGDDYLEFMQGLPKSVRRLTGRIPLVGLKKFESSLRTPRGIELDLWYAERFEKLDEHRLQELDRFAEEGRNRLRYQKLKKP
ncbi:hypothetical protein T439DRAFT_349567 [Meredithblackwellia eburnea MCA 4105]